MKKLIVSAIIFSLILLGLIIFYPNLSLLYLIKSRYSVIKTPWAYVVPIERTIERSNVGLNDYQTISFSGLKFMVPWRELRANESIETGLFLSSAGGQRQGIFVSTSQVSVANLRERLGGDNPADAEMIKALLGNDSFKSEYDLYNQCLSTSPDQIGIFTPKRELGKAFVLLMLKRILTRYNVKIYRFQAKGLKGFQFGDPKTNTEVETEFFNGKGKKYRMKFISVNQNELDYILASIEK
jgi:hypothetical protein